MAALEEIPFAIPVISALIERTGPVGTELLVQTRIAKYDGMYSGTLEIAAGKIERFENVYATVRREVKEETGLEVLEIKGEMRNTFKTSRNDEAFVFQPFCCQQLLRGSIPWVGFVFLCTVKEGVLKPQANETRDVRWMKLRDVRGIVDDTPEKIFTLQLPVLDHYLRQKGV